MTDLPVARFIADRIAEERADPSADPASWKRQRALAQLDVIERLITATGSLPDSAPVDYLTAGELRRLLAHRWRDHPGFADGWAFAAGPGRPARGSAPRRERVS